MEISLIPSLISQTQKEARDRMEKLLPYSSVFQLDVMDGTFVPHTSLFPKLPKLPRTGRNNRAMKNITYEAHLMVANPLPWLVQNKAQIQGCVIHYESKAHIHDIIKWAQKEKKYLGIALNPETEAEALMQYLKLIDKVLVMTVHPGKYGATFLPEVVPKIKSLRKKAPGLDIEIDGAMNPRTITVCKKAGANQFVIGSFLQKTKNVAHAWKELEKAIAA